MFRLEFSNVTKSFSNQIKALDSVSFNVGDGEIVGLIGSNGAGKTTTINICTKLIEQYEGSVFLNEINIKDIRFKDYPISYIPDEPVFYEFLTLQEHLTFVQSLYQNKAVLSIESLMSRLDLEPHVNKMPHQLSRGTKQKLMIAMALLRDYSTLIADEPFTGLDPYQIGVFKRILVDLRNTGKSILVSTHLLDIVESLCDRYVLLHNGKVLAIGSKEELSRLVCINESTSLENIFMHFLQAERRET